MLASGSGKPLAIACGIVIRFWMPFSFGLSSTITWNWLAKISTPMPASMPLITAGDTARNHWPSLKTPATICSDAGDQHDGAERLEADTSGRFRRR